MNLRNVLIVDDEQGILNSLKRLLRQEHIEIDTINSPLEALKMVEKKNYTLVISDQRMPEMEGAELLEKIKEISPQSVRILLTGYTDIKAAMDSVNKGGIYRFLTKPWNDDSLKSEVRAALQYAELEQSFMGSVKALSLVSEKANSFMGHHSKRVAKLAVEIAKKMGLKAKDIFQIEMAALLHDVGKMLVPSPILETKEDKLKDTERAILKRHPEFGEGILRSMPNLLEASKIVRHHHENMDGTGYPDRLQSSLIPVGSRIIAAADAFDKALNTKEVFKSSTLENALEYVTSLTPKILDKSIVLVLKECARGFLINRDYDSEIEVKPYDLTAGMTLSRDIKTLTGVLLLAKDTLITAENFLQTQKYLAAHPFIEGIFVFRNNPLKTDKGVSYENTAAPA
ncbi:response regulator [bacterium]|nr:response regulator [bacterium]